MKKISLKLLTAIIFVIVLGFLLSSQKNTYAIDYCVGCSDIDNCKVANCTTQGGRCETRSKPCKCQYGDGNEGAWVTIQETKCMGGGGGGGGGAGNKTCNQLCVNDNNCISGLSCVTVSGVVGKRCRASNCQGDISCGCANATPTPTGPTPTPGGPTLTPTPTGTVPTPTDNPNCKCNTLNSCTNACTFDKYTDVTYNNPIKCGVANNKFQSNPTNANKDAWCRAEKKTKGDADLNGVVNLLDYFYFIHSKIGAKVPATVNPDFNGDNQIDNDDSAIIIKTLKTGGF